MCSNVGGCAVRFGGCAVRKKKTHKSQSPPPLSAEFYVSLARSVPKPLKVPSLARSVPKPLKVPNIEFSR